MVGSQVKSDDAEPRPSSSAGAAQPQAMEVGVQNSTSAENLAKKVIIDAKMEKARDQTRNAKAEAEMYDKVRDDAAGPTAAPATMTFSTRIPSRRPSSSSSSTSSSSRTSTSTPPRGRTRGRDRRHSPPRSPDRARIRESALPTALLGSGTHTRRGTDSFQCRVTMTMTERKIYTTMTKAKLMRHSGRVLDQNIRIFEENREPLAPSSQMEQRRPRPKAASKQSAKKKPTPPRSDNLKHKAHLISKPDGEPPR